YLVVLGVNILFLLLGFFSILPRFSSVMIFLSTAMMFRAGHELTNGGHQLMSILLGYNLLMSERGNESFYANVVSNLVVFLAMFQVVCVYLFAGLFKLQGNMWLSGSALYQVLSLKTYSHPIFYGLMHETFLLKGVNYIGLVYQLMFPFLIWSKRLRLPLLVLGMLFHLFIVFGMGLPAFGIFMMASYSIFASKSFAVSFGEKFNALLSRLKLFV
ncbi:MAG: HTTM domain-containing protein, partial [Flavobacteriales bacterium]|nr:HTTM domain-containing protein [Flavobacteriales bacterium]